MKKYTAYKTVQLILFLALAALIIWRIFPDSAAFHQVATDSFTQLLAWALWAALGLSFLFILLYYTFFFGYRKEYREMEFAAQSDPVSGIANRFYCDMMIEKYLDKPLPEHLGCIMFNLTNIQEINRLYGHVLGNEAIRDFSGILSLSSEELCFVGRNGGNKFLAIFEKNSAEDMQKYLDRVAQRVGQHNADVTKPEIKYNYGSAYSDVDKAEDITALISLANSRIA